MSWPHYYQDFSLKLNSLNGMSPAEEELHQFFVDIQPQTGIPLRLRRRVQFNLLLNKTSNNAMPMVYPLFWIESGYDTLPMAVFHQLRMVSLLSMSFVFCSLTTIMIAGFFCLVLLRRMYCFLVPGFHWSYMPVAG